MQKFQEPNKNPIKKQSKIHSPSEAYNTKKTFHIFLRNINLTHTTWSKISNLTQKNYPEFQSHTS